MQKGLYRVSWLVFLSLCHYIYSTDASVLLPIPVSRPFLQDLVEHCQVFLQEVPTREDVRLEAALLIRVALFYLDREAVIEASSVSATTSPSQVAMYDYSVSRITRDGILIPAAFDFLCECSRHKQYDEAEYWCNLATAQKDPRIRATMYVPVSIASRGGFWRCLCFLVCCCNCCNCYEYPEEEVSDRDAL